jgi:1-acyl-sn-glycerol-3-phosphate acyltransferase
MMWATDSGCGPHCLRGEDVAPAGRVRRAARLAALTAVIAVGAATLLLPRRWRGWAVRGCARAALRAVGVRWRVKGRLPARHALVVANHISWLDTVVLLAAGVPRLVAKSEVRHWPLIGRISAQQGGVFLDRSRPRTLPVAVREVRDILAAGGVVAVFPEGTTSCGEGAGGFRPAFFQAAIDAPAPVVPVTLRFESGGAPSTWPAFLGTETLLASLRRVLAIRRLVIRVSIGTPIHAGPGASRKALARVAGAAVYGLPVAPLVAGRDELRLAA